MECENHQRTKFAVHHNALISHNTVIHVSVGTNQALLITTVYKT